MKTIWLSIPLLAALAAGLQAAPPVEAESAAARELFLANASESVSEEQVDEVIRFIAQNLAV